MIKKVILGLGISFLSLVGFSSASSLSGTYDLPLYFSLNNSDLKISKDTFFGNSVNNKLVGYVVVTDSRAVDYSYLWFWQSNSLYSMVIVNGIVYKQGYFNKMGLSSGSPTLSMTESPSSFYNGDYGNSFDSVYIYAVPNGYYANLCFIKSNNYYCFSSYGEDNLYDSAGYSFSSALDAINEVNAGFPPFSNGGGGGSINNNYLCPTVGQLLNTYGSEYNTGLCYSSSLIMSGGSVVSVSPQSIFDLFPTQSDFVNYRQLYSNYCSQSPVAGVSSSCSSAFQGKDIEYTLIAKIPGSINSLSLYSYCNLALNQDPNTSTCVASGVYNTGVSRQDVINSIVNGNYQVVSPISGSITSNVIGSGEYFNGDILGSIQSIYTKFTSLFTTQSGNVVGILPGYIVVMLLVIILFRLFKK